VRVRSEGFCFLLLSFFVLKKKKKINYHSSNMYPCRDALHFSSRLGSTVCAWEKQIAVFFIGEPDRIDEIGLILRFQRCKRHGCGPALPVLGKLIHDNGGSRGLVKY
jgi:hypothetical protein